MSDVLALNIKLNLIQEVVKKINCNFLLKNEFLSLKRDPIIVEVNFHGTKHIEIQFLTKNKSQM